MWLERGYVSAQLGHDESIQFRIFSKSEIEKFHHVPVTHWRTPSPITQRQISEPNRVAQKTDRPTHPPIHPLTNSFSGWLLCAGFSHDCPHHASDPLATNGALEILPVHGCQGADAAAHEMPAGQKQHLPWPRETNATRRHYGRVSGVVEFGLMRVVHYQV